MKDKVIAGVAIVALVVAGLSLLRPAPERVVEKVLDRVGVASGPEHTEHQVFLQNFRLSGSYSTTTTATSHTLSEVETDPDVSYVSWNTGQNITVTLPASTSAPFSGLKTGDIYEQVWYSATTTAAATITFAAGTGIDLQEDEGGTVIVNGLEAARVTYIKKADSDVAVIVEPYQVGD